MKIGILGGAFNPPHQMHFKMAQELIEKHLIDKAIFVPVGNHYHKKDLIAIADRIFMLQLMCAGYPNMEVSNFEDQKQVVNTNMTLAHFQACYPNDTLYFVLGSDNLKELDTWDGYEEMLTHYYFIVIPRNDDNINEIIAKYAPYQDHIIFAKLTKSTISSTQVRKCIRAHQEENMTPYVNSKVMQYVKQKRLYYC